MLPLKDYLANPAILFSSLLEHYGTWIPERIYLKWLFRLKTGNRLDLIHPQSFGEKIQWLKLYNRKPEYTEMVDKIAVKGYVADILGSEYVIPTIGVWDNPDEIDWDSLPFQFVLKTSHGGGSSGVVICKDKSSFIKQEAISRLKKSMRNDIYRILKEWPYKNVPKRIIAEEFICPEHDAKDLADYKWYCFNGEPVFCQVIQNRSIKETIDFFDTKWVHQDFIGLNPLAIHATEQPSRPHDLEGQIRIARKLSKGIPFVRVDLYQAEERIFFGEITFYPMSGFGRFVPEQYNTVLGNMLVLPAHSNQK